MSCRNDRVWSDWIVTLVLLSAMALVFIGPSLDGDIFLSTEVVYRSTQPWSGLSRVEPPPHNPFLSDQSTIYYPLLAHTRDQIRSGRFPLWSGESYGGVPYFGNFSVGLLSPFTWLFVLLPFASAFAIVAALKWILAGLGAMCLARALGLRGVPAVLTGLLYAFCGYQVIWVNAALTHVAVVAPWCVVATEKLLWRPDGRRMALLSMFLFFQLMGGHPESSFFTSLGVGIYGVGRIVTESDHRVRRLGLMLGAHGAALGLSSIQLLPFLEYAFQSEGFRTRGGDLYRPLVSTFGLAGMGTLAAIVFLIWVGRRFSKGRLWFLLAIAFVTGTMFRCLGVQPTLLLQFLPDLYGTPLDGGQYFGPYSYSDVNGAFCGSAGLLLAVAAVFRKPSATIVVLAVDALILSAPVFRVPFLSDALGLLPWFEKAHATRALGMVALFVSVLAGFGARSFLERPRSFVRPMLGTAAFVLGLAVPMLSLVVRFEARTDRSGDASFETLPTTWRPSGSRVADYKFKIKGRVSPDIDRIRIDVSGEAIADLAPEAGSFSADWVGLYKLPEGRYPINVSTLMPDGSTTRIGRSFLDLVRPFRFASRHLALPLVLGLLVLVGVAVRRRWSRPLMVVIVVFELTLFGARYNDTTPREEMPRAVEPIPWLMKKMDEEGPFRFLGARTILQPNLHYLFGLHALRGYDALEPRTYAAVVRRLFPGAQQRIQYEQDFSTMDLESPIADLLNLRFVLSEESSPDAGWVERWRSGPLALFENVDVLERAFTVRQVWSMEAHGNRPPSGDPREMAIWETGEDLLFGSRGSVERMEYENGQINVEVASEHGTVLVVSENFAPGWEARIDGHKTAVHRTHGTLLSVVVPSGKRLVELVYRPSSFLWGGVLSALTALGVGMAAVARSSRRRDGRNDRVRSGESL